jgi:hypothetical protein
MVYIVSDARLDQDRRRWVTSYAEQVTVEPPVRGRNRFDPEPRDDRVEAEMRVYIWCDGVAMPNGGPAGAGYAVVGGLHLLGSEALGDATNNVAEYTAVRNALRAAADATTALPDRATAIKRVAFPPKSDRPARATANRQADRLP